MVKPYAPGHRLRAREDDRASAEAAGQALLDSLLDDRLGDVVDEVEVVTDLGGEVVVVSHAAVSCIQASSHARCRVAVNHPSVIVASAPSSPQ